MIKDEAVAEVEMLNWGGISFNTEEVISFINQQAEQIERMKNCQNCKHEYDAGYTEVVPDCYCVGCKDESKWEGLQ